jgi:hypothetical protein
MELKIDLIQLIFIMFPTLIQKIIMMLHQTENSLEIISFQDYLNLIGKILSLLTF